MNIFRFICIWIMLTYAVKIVINIYFGNKFYVWARGLFAQAKMPMVIKLLMLDLIFLWVLTFYGTFFAYVKYGWILTAAMALTMLQVLPQMFFWSRIAPKFVKMLDFKPGTIWLFSVLELLTIVGVGLLGFLVY